jgi:hypothetical protein
MGGEFGACKKYLMDYYFCEIGNIGKLVTPLSISNLFELFELSPVQSQGPSRPHLVDQFLLGSLTTSSLK